VTDEHAAYMRMARELRDAREAYFRGDATAAELDAATSALNARMAGLDAGAVAGLPVTGAHCMEDRAGHAGNPRLVAELAREGPPAPRSGQQALQPDGGTDG